MRALRTLVALVVIVVACNVLSEVAEATPFQNGDFSSGFLSWQGDASGSIPDPATSPLYTITSDQAALVNSDLVLFPVTLFQNFTLSPKASSISFSLEWHPTGTDDLVFAMLGDQAGLLTPIDLFSGKDPLTNSLFSADISSLAGQDVQLYFTLLDLSFDPDAYQPDVMKIDNIMIAQADTAAPVPEPATVVLLGFGIAGIVLIRRSRTA